MEEKEAMIVDVTEEYKNHDACAIKHIMGKVSC